MTEQPNPRAGTSAAELREGQRKLREQQVEQERIAPPERKVSHAA